MRIRLPHVALAGVLALTLTGGAVAAIPGADGTIQSCYGADGAVRIVEGETNPGRICNPGETHLAWGQKGPAGATGPAGPKGATGATGPQGPAGPSFVWARFRNQNLYPAMWFTTVARLKLPKGLYRVSAKTVAFQDEVPGYEAWTLVTCRLVRNDPNGDIAEYLDQSQAEVSDEGPERSTLSLDGLVYVPAADGEVAFQCKDDGGFISGPNNELRNSKLLAQQVGGYTADAS